MALSATLLLTLAQAGSVEVQGTPVAVDFVQIPAGRSRDGASLLPFGLASREITWEAFNAFALKGNAADAVTRPSIAGTLIFPPIGIPQASLETGKPAGLLSWINAVHYAEWISLRSGAYVRLPTEAEWERAAGDLPATPEDHGWFKENSAGHPQAPGRKPANEFGVHDLFGNAWEYVLEFHDGNVFDPVLKGGSHDGPPQPARHRQRILREWIDADPSRPRSVWWLMGSQSFQGIRLVCAAGTADRAARRAAAAKVRLEFHGSEDAKFFPQGGRGFAMELARVRAEVVNGSDRTLDEVEVGVWYLDPKGRPHKVDGEGLSQPGAATYSKAWPVMVNSFHAGEARRPLKPGERRRFTIDVPKSYDPEGLVEMNRFGGRCTNVRLSP